MTKQVDETLAQRGKHYGDFAKTFDVIQQIKDALKDGIGWAAMPPERREALEMIAVKLGRLVSGDSGHADSWHDIAGYARLVEESVTEKASPLEAIKIPVRMVFEEQESAAVRLCVECQHYRLDEAYKRSGEQHRCTNPDFVHVVLGNDVDCNEMRYRSSTRYPSCGVQGRSFTKSIHDAFKASL